VEQSVVKPTPMRIPGRRQKGTRSHQTPHDER
jgi:hypothetical protein